MAIHASEEKTEAVLRVGGRIFGGWTEFAVERSLLQGASTFELTQSERWPEQEEAWLIEPGAACTIELAGELVFTGYVDDFEPGFDAETHAVRVSGRSKTADLVDCAALVKGGQFRNYTIEAIARSLAAPFGIDVVMEAPAGPAFADVQVNPGETCFALIERLCRLRALLASDDEHGNLVLTRAGAGGHGRAGALIQGINIRSASGRLSHANRFSDYIVKGQQAGSDHVDGAAAARPSGAVKDAAIRRYRPRVEMAEEQASAADARARAQWAQRFAAADGVSVTIQTDGFHDAGGALWRAGRLSRITSPWLHLDEDLLLATVKYSKGAEGSLTEITAKPADALTPEPATDRAASGKSANAWSEVI